MNGKCSLIGSSLVNGLNEVRAKEFLDVKWAGLLLGIKQSRHEILACYITNKGRIRITKYCVIVRQGFKNYRDKGEIK